MYKLLLVCSGGYTSSMLARRLAQHIRQDRLAYTVKSVNAATGLQICREYDLTLLSPQVSFTYDLFEKKLKLSRRKPVVLDKEAYFFADAQKVLHLAEENLATAQITPLRAAFVCGRQENLLFEQCYRGVQQLAQERGIRLAPGFYMQSEIFSPDFDCDIIVFGFSFFKGNSDLQRGFFGEKQIPFFILHLLYSSGGDYGEVIRQIFLEYNLAYENLEIEE